MERGVLVERPISPQLIVVGSILRQNSTQLRFTKNDNTVHTLAPDRSDQPFSEGDLFKSRCRLEAENLFLRHQLSIALRRTPPRVRLRGSDRALLVWMTRLWPSLLGAAQVVQPETILRWHRAGFKVFWRWKSRTRAGRPKIDRGLRELIKRMSEL